MYKFHVWLDGKHIDTICFEFIGRTKAAAVEAVRTTLIHHDGYDSRIKVTWPKGQTVRRVWG